MAFVIENLRLKELVAVANANQVFFDDFLSFLKAEGFSTLHDFVCESDPQRGFEVIKKYLETPAKEGITLKDGTGADYRTGKARWLLLGWIFRDAPEQRLKPLVPSVQGASTTIKQATLLNEIRSHVSAVYPSADEWSWAPIKEVMVDRLEGSRRAKKGSLFELIVRRAVQKHLDRHTIVAEVLPNQIKIGEETYDVVVTGSKKTMVMPVKTRETMGGGHAHIFTRDIRESISAAATAGYTVFPIVIAESWTGNLDGLQCNDYIYLAINRACQIFCVNGVSVVNGESIAELNGKTSQRRFPVADRHRPFLADVA